MSCKEYDRLAGTRMTYVLLIEMTDKMEYVCLMVCSQYAPWYVDSSSDALGHECQMMGHTMDKIRVQVKGHNNPSNIIDLRGSGESLMLVMQLVSIPLPPAVFMSERKMASCLFLHFLILSSCSPWIPSSTNISMMQVSLFLGRGICS